MSIIKHYKKILIIAVFAAFLGVLLNANLAIGSASIFNDLFDAGDRGLTFTEYEGTLAELSTEYYAEELVASTDLRAFIIKIVNYAV